MLARRLIPADVMEECRAAALLDNRWTRPRNWISGGAIVVIWVAATAAALYWIFANWFRGSS